MRDKFIEKYCDFIKLIEVEKNELLKDIIINDPNNKIKKELLSKYNDLMIKQCNILYDMMRNK